MKQTLIQAATLKNLMLGDYNGSLKVKDILKEADFGIGTFSYFDGEAIFLNGHAYNGRADGKLYEMESEDSCPFCQVTKFNELVEEKPISFDSIDDLTTKLNQEFDSKNYFYALKINGIFNVKYRSCFKTSKPFKPLFELAKGQVVFEKENIKGTIVAIFSPSFTDGISLHGWHLHFVDENLSTGGHVLTLSSKNASFKLNKIDERKISFPESDEFKENDLTKDLKEETKAVEG